MNNLSALEAKLQGAPLSAVLGGPVRPDRSLTLVAFEGQPLVGQLTRFVRVLDGSDSRDAWRGRATQDGSEHAAGEVAGLLSEQASPSGGPTEERRSGGPAMGLAASDGAAAGGASGRGAAVENMGAGSRGGTRCAGALFGEPQHVAEALAQHPQLRPMAARIFQGHAVWSSEQLLGEVARGSWGIVPAFLSDLEQGCVEQRSRPSVAGAQPGQRAEDAGALWPRVWADRPVLFQAAHGPQVGDLPMDARAAAAPCPGPDAHSTQTSNPGCLGVSACVLS